MKHTITITKEQKNLIIEALEHYTERLKDDFSHLSPEDLEDRQISAEEIITDLTDDDDGE